MENWRDWRLSGASVALTLGGMGTRSLPLAILALLCSWVAFVRAPKLSKRELMLQQRERTNAELKQRLARQREGLEEECRKLEQQQEELRQSRLASEELQETVLAWKQKIEQQTQADIAKQQAQFDAQKQQIFEQLKATALAQANEYLASKFQAEWQSIQEKEAEISRLIPVLEEEWKKRFAQFQAYGNEQIAQRDKEMEEFVQEHNQKLQEVRALSAQSHNTLRQIYAQATQGMAQELHVMRQPVLPSPEYYEDCPRASLVAERCLRFLFDKGLYLDFAQCDETPESAVMLFKPKKGAMDVVDTYTTIRQQLPALQALSEGCNNAPEVAINHGMFRIDFDMSGLTAQQRAAKVRSKDIEELPPNWLEEIVRNCFHFRVNGQTRAGKSTFVNNLIGLMRRMFESEIEIILIDPKYPLSRWSIKPQYRGIEEAIIGLKDMANEVELRLKLATEDADAGKPIRKFKPTIYVLDEVDWVSSEYNDPVPIVSEYLTSLELGTKKAAATLLKKGLKVGAALQVMVCYIGQSPLCTDIGMRKNDFSNSANFFLGENIPPAIEEVAFKQQQPYLRRQYQLRVQRAEQYLGTAEENHYKYFCLVKAPGMSAKLATLPLAGTYDFVPEEESVGDEENPNPPIAWTDDASPEVLVNSARTYILRCIKDGMTNPLDICREIWGDIINPQSLPYNGKLGVKVRIEYLIENEQKSAIS